MCARLDPSHRGLENLSQSRSSIIRVRLRITANDMIRKRQASVNGQKKVVRRPLAFWFESDRHHEGVKAPPRSSVTRDDLAQNRGK